MELVGRENEIGLLRTVAARAAAGDGSLVLLSGEAGIGKSSVAAVALEESGLRVVQAAASPFGAAPLGLLRTIAKSIGGVLPCEVPDAERLQSGVVEALCRAVSEPVAIVLDDLQWSDLVTLDLLPALADAVRGRSILLLGIYSVNASAGNHRLKAVCDTLRRAHRLMEIRIAPLDLPAIRSLACRAAGASLGEDVIARIARASGGIPIFVEALARAVAGGAPALPETLRDAVLARLGRLGPDAQAAGEAAAVLGGRFDFSLVARLAGGEASIGPLLESGLVVETGGVGTFRPAAAGEAVYDALGWTRRRQLHRAAAEALEAGNPEQAAEHWGRAGNAERARRALLEAASRAIRLHASSDAALFLQKALDLWPPEVDVNERLHALDSLGNSAKLAGERNSALRAWREALDTAPEDAHRVKARAARNIANLQELAGDWTSALAAREQARAAFAKSGEPAEAALEGIAAAVRLRQQACHGAALRAADQAAVHALAADRTDLQVRIAALKGNLEARLGRTEEGIRAVRQALDAALELDQPTLAGEIYQRLADALERSGDYRRATEVNLEGIDFCERRASPPGVLACLACVSWIMIRAGDWDSAVAASRRMAEEFPGTPVGRPVGLGHIGLVHALRGEARRAEPLLIEAAAASRTIGHALLEVNCLWGLALLALAGGKLPGAVEHCLAILDRISRGDERHACVPALRWAASCLAAAGEKAALGRSVALLNDAVGRFGSGEPLSALASALGESALLDGDPLRAAEHFERSIELLEDLQLPRERIEAELRASAACGAAGRAEVAAAHAREAARRAERLGARPLREAAAARLRELGEPVAGALGVRGVRRQERGGLSPRQLQILRAISKGMTDKEVARQLALSPRTIESHVAKALEVLDCRSRSEAVRRAGELGLLA